MIRGQCAKIGLAPNLVAYGKVLEFPENGLACAIEVEYYKQDVIASRVMKVINRVKSPKMESCSRWIEAGGLHKR